MRISPAPWAKSSASGSAKVRKSGATATSAKPPSMQKAATRSPAATPAPSGALRTTPATSLPGTNGSGGLIWYSPRVCSTSGNETPAACTSTTTPSAPVIGWVGPARGCRRPSARRPGRTARLSVGLACGAGYCQAYCPHGRRPPRSGGAAVRRHRSALVRPRPDRGRGARPRRAHLHDRHAARGGARPRRGRPQRPVLRPAAQGRRLLGELGADGGAVRRRRAARQAQLQADRLGALLHRVPVDAADGGARRLAALARGPADVAARGDGDHALADARALRARGGDRAADRARRRARRRRSGRSTSTGTATASPRACAATRSRSGRASCASHRPSRSSTRRAGATRRCGSRRAAAAAGSTLGWSRRCGARAPTRRSGARSRRATWRRGSPASGG